MSKTIPVALQTHYDEAVNTKALIIRVQKNVGANGTPSAVGIACHDASITYDNGDGSIVYSALGGFQPSSIFTASDLSVDNAEAEVLIPAFDLGPVIEEEVRAGLWDGAEFVAMMVNWRDLTMGHEEVMYGTIGQARTINGLVCFVELNGPQKPLKQVGIGVTSVTCRVRTFGSQVGEEPYPCLYNATALWSGTATVDGLGAESDRVFTGTHPVQVDDYYTPGLVQWLTGDNTGLTSEVESYATDIISLRFATPYAIQFGDTYKIRKECTRRWSGANSCDTFANRNNFRGEPHMPLADQNQLATPFASSPSPNSGTGVADPLNPGLAE